MKKACSLLLTVLLLFSVMLPAFGEEELPGATNESESQGIEMKSAGDVPVIVLSGDGNDIFDADGNKAYSLDKQHLRSVATLLDIGLDLLFGLLDKILGTFMVDVNELAFAIHDPVWSERFEDGIRSLLALYEFADEGVVGDLQGLESAPTAAKESPDGGNRLADAVADGGLSLRDGSHFLLELSQARFRTPS